MDFVALKAELDTDPLGRGYAGMDNAAASADLNTVYRTLDKDVLTGLEVRGAVDATEWAALTADDKQLALILFTAAELDASTGGPDDNLISSIFGAGSTTRSNLAAVRAEAVSRSVELGFGLMRSGYVEQARAL